jgi:protein-tyrosine phosphatase
MDEIVERLFVGDMADAQNAPPDFFVLCVLEARPPGEPQNATWIPFLENGKANHAQLDIIATVIDRQLQSGKRVMVHCGAGIERSPLCAVWYLHTKKAMSIDEAYKLVMSKRPIVQDRRIWL